MTSRSHAGGRMSVRTARVFGAAIRRHWVRLAAARGRRPRARPRRALRAHADGRRAARRRVSRRELEGRVADRIAAQRAHVAEMVLLAAPWVLGPLPGELV